MNQHSTRKRRAASLSVVSNLVLILLKLGVGLAIGSVSVISEAIHSALDLLAALIAFVSVRAADRPPDENHRYGHGKIEHLSSTVQASLIFVAAGLIVYHALHRLLEGGGLDTPLPGLAVMAVSALVNTAVSRHLARVGRETNSVALEADAWHLRTDVATSLGVFAGLALVQLTGWYQLDSLVAIGVALWIARTAWTITHRSTLELTDVSLPPEDEAAIHGVLARQPGPFQSWHGLRTRRSGGRRLVDFHLVMEHGVTVEQAHELCDRLEAAIERELPNSDVTIHVEPPSPWRERVSQGRRQHGRAPAGPHPGQRSEQG